MPTVEETIIFIQQAHAGQVDAAGEEYWKHPIAVMDRLPAGTDDDVRLAALLHDVLEDTEYTRTDLEGMGYSKRTLDVVELVTKKTDAPSTGDKYQDYERAIVALIAVGNRDAIQLKLADMSENADPTRIAALEPVRRTHFERKYTRPLALLRAAVG